MSSSDARPTDLDDDGRSAEEQGRAAGASEPPAEAPSPLEASVPPPSAQASAPPAARSGDSASAHGAVPNRDEEPPPSSLGVSALRRDNRRLLLVLAAVLALGAMVGGVVWWRTRALLPPPDEKLLEKVAAVNFTELPPHLRSAAAAETLAELEAKRLPRALVKALEGIPRYPPSMRTVAMLEAFSDPDVLSEWKKTCEEGPAALGKMATLAPLEQGAFLYKHLRARASPAARRERGPGSHGRARGARGRDRRLPREASRALGDREVAPPLVPQGHRAAHRERLRSAPVRRRPVRPRSAQPARAPTAAVAGA
jgi:hypothetical protein